MKSQKRDHVVLIHGLGRSRLAMLGLHWWLSRAGFRVHNIGYPSRRLRVQEAADDWLKPALESIQVDPEERVHFVTHSLGSIVFRAWAAQRDPAFPLGRTVMLAPPNQGSEIIDHLESRAWIRWLLGPVVEEMGTGVHSTPNRLGAVPPETTVLMGSRSVLTLFQHLLGPESDGIVSVARAHVQAESAFHFVDADHATIIWRVSVLRKVTAIIKGDL